MAATLTAPPPAVGGHDLDADELDAFERRMHDNKVLEYSGGEFREKNVSRLTSLVGGDLAAELVVAARRPDRSRLAEIYVNELQYRLWPDRPLKTRRPDLSLIAVERLEDIPIDAGQLRIVPDLIVEVVSPNDKAIEVDEKQQDYHEVRAPLCWWIWPGSRRVDVHVGLDVTRLHIDDELTLPGLLPDFRLRVGDLLPERNATAG